VARLLSDAGYDAIHVGDLDMLGRHPGPSVVLLRRVPHRPDEQAELLRAALELLQDDIEAGAVVVLSRGRARVRHLPIAPD
jgi:predicted urease superfamily metal-dependent hydrolase